MRLVGHVLDHMLDHIPDQILDHISISFIIIAL